MRKDHRPYWLASFFDRVNAAYGRRVVQPQFDSIGCSPQFCYPRGIEIIGDRITAGDYLYIMATPDRWVSIVVWPFGDGRITIGDYVGFSPGIRVSSACSISIGHGCLLAQNVYITDADWHGVYDRVHPPGEMAPVTIEDNVWLADGVTVCKGVTIGRNSVVGAGSVVVKDIPPNVVAAGNPARVLRELDNDGPRRTRDELFLGPRSFTQRLDDMTRAMTEGNTFAGWIRSMVAPTRDM